MCTTGWWKHLHRNRRTEETCFVDRPTLQSFSTLVSAILEIVLNIHTVILNVTVQAVRFYEIVILLKCLFFVIKCVDRKSVV